MDSYSRGTEVDIKAPTQRSLCFFLWFMYCKILKEGKVLVMQWMVPSLEFAPRANEIQVGSASPVGIQHHTIIPGLRDSVLPLGEGETRS